MQHHIYISLVCVHLGNMFCRCVCLLALSSNTLNYHPRPPSIFSIQAEQLNILQALGMSPRDWFRTIVKLKRGKRNHSKQVKAQCTADISNGTSYLNSSHHEELSLDVDNGNLVVNPKEDARSIEDMAATQIQTAFRSFRERKTVHPLKESDRFQTYIEDPTAAVQVRTALSYIHAWSRIQYQIRARRICMVTQARMKQKKLENQLKLDAKLHELEVEWCSGSETMEEILSRIQQREAAAVKRERAMAYAFSHQWRPNCSQYFGQASYILDKENSGWSWLDRWIAARPWEVRVRVQPSYLKLHDQNCTKWNYVSSHRETKLASVIPTLSNGKEISKGKEKKLTPSDCHL